MIPPNPSRRAVTYARREDPAEAMIAVAEEHDADLLVVGIGA